MRAIVQLVGDGIDGSFVTWEIHGRPGSLRWARRRPERIREAVGRLRGALPESTPTADEWRELPRLPRGLPDSPEVRALHQAMTGPLTDPVRERELMTELGSALLPPDFVQDLRNAGTRDELPELRIAPSPLAAQVPWGLLIVDEDGTRLIELADLVWIAPLVERDLAADAQHSWQELRDRPCLHIIDPATENQARVINPREDLYWASHKRSHPDCAFQQPVSRAMLSHALQSPHSRLFFVGHVTTAVLKDHQRAVALCLSDGPDTFAIGYARDSTDPRPLSDIDLVRGIPESSAAELNAGSLVGEVPSAAMVDDRVQPTPGRLLWPMPDRVAIIACGSGPDMREAEPFGLVTACVLAGARLVNATLWTLPTNTLYAHYGWPGRFTELTEAADRIQTTLDPVIALSEWQRERLAEWRAPGADPSRSPLWWGGLVHFAAPERNIPAIEQSGSHARHRPG